MDLTMEDKMKTLNRLWDVLAIVCMSSLVLAAISALAALSVVMWRAILGGCG